MFTITKYIPEDSLTALCSKHHIKKLSLFGSALGDKFNENSDIDLLVEFEDGHAPGLLGLAGVEIELTKMLGRRVDLRTPAELSRFFRDEVLSQARIEYAA